MFLIPCIYEGNHINWVLNKQAFAKCKKQAQARAQAAKKASYDTLSLVFLW